MTDIIQIQELAALGIDYAGLIFYRNSPRYVGGKIYPQEIESLPDQTGLIGVFVNEDVQVVKTIVSRYRLNAIQLCGDESPAYCEDLMKTVEVIKVIPVGDRIDLAVLQQYKNSCNFFLFDTRSKKYGGSGVHFDWRLLQHADIGKPFFLSGGLGPKDTDRLREFYHSSFYGIDLNSRFETAPGIKDIKKIKVFIDKLKKQ